MLIGSSYTRLNRFGKAGGRIVLSEAGVFLLLNPCRLTEPVLVIGAAFASVTQAPWISSLSLRPSITYELKPPSSLKSYYLLQKVNFL